MTNLKHIKKSFYIIVVFFSITLFGSLSISTFESIIKDSVTSGLYSNKSATLCNLLDINNLSKDDFLDSIKSTPNLYIEKNGLQPGSLSGKAIYFDNLPDVVPNMVSGNFFSKDDFFSNTPVAVVGKEVFKNAKKVNGDNFFEYENIKYKIIGVMGYENRSSTSDLQFIINLNSYIQNSSSQLSSSNYLIDNSKKDSTNVFNTFIDNVKKRSPDFKYETISSKKNKNLLNQALVDGFNSMIFFVVLIVLILINVVNITLQWIDGKKKEIGVKKALGGSNLKISLEIIGEYQLLSLFSYIIGMIIYILVIKLKVFSIFNADIYLLSTFLTFLFSSLTALIISILAIIKALKFPPSIIMKGGKL